MSTIQTSEYRAFIKEIKQKVREAQIKASVKVNTTLLEFYWELGREIVARQKGAEWGSGFLQQLSRDLMHEFPDMKGFSLRNIKYIRQWYLFYESDVRKRQQLVAQLIQVPWGHHIYVITKCHDVEEALFYISKTIENGWSRSILIHQIESRLYERNGKALTNFEKTLPKPQSDLANEMIKDPYHFDFLTLREPYKEKELEQGLLDNITSFLLELGQGFALVGKQKQLTVGTREFYLDLLFYHTRMHCYVVVELKTTDFEPEYAGKLNFYIKAVDEQIKTERDEPTIGILLCKSKDKVVVEYALSDIYKPIGVSEYQLTHILTEELKSTLPSVEAIETELENLA